MGKLDGKVAIVTGSADGIGAATASLLAREGAKVVVADVNAGGARERAQLIKDEGGEALAVPVDIGDEAAIRQMIEATVATFGGIDILHNNASAMNLTPRDGALVDSDVEVWDGTMQVNLRGTMLCTKYALPHIIARGGGSIVNTSSDQALLGDTGQTAYAAAKLAVTALTRSVATQHGRDNVRCNAICPGLILTPRLLAKLDEAARARLIIHHLLPRAGTPEDVAELVLFLCSDAGSFITGQVISVDGGLIAHMPSYADGGNIKR